jgi:hypothetical protein
MKNIFLKSILLFSLATGLLSSCVEDTITEVTTFKTYNMSPTITVDAVNAAATGAPVLYANDDIIEAYVTSSDEEGNFYKSISFQTIPTVGNPIGFSVPINASTLFGKGFAPGRKVYIKLKGLYTAKVFGSLQIGSLFEGSIGRISENVWQNHLFPSEERLKEDSFVRTMTLGTAINDANQNTLIELDPVQFADGSLNRTYYDVDSGGGSTNHMIMATTGGTERIIRFSSFAPFTGRQVPSGSGKIRGVLTKYNSDYQFIVRYEGDIKLTSPRVDASLPVGGTSLVYSGALSENFETGYAVNQSIFPKYINDAFVGSRYWQLKTFSSNEYIEMTSFSGSGVPGTNAKTFFFVPVDFTAANTFTFKKEVRFNQGTALKVYYVSSANYTPGGVANPANFTNITSSFNITYPAIGASESAFNSAGVYNIPVGLTGTGFFVFEYAGGGAVTTTIQIDDIVIN